MADRAQPTQRVTLRELTSHQRRELGAIMSAGIASTAFFLVPFVQVIAPAPLPSEPMALQMTTVTASPRSLAIAPPRAAKPRRRAEPLPHRNQAVMMLAGVDRFPPVERVQEAARAPGRMMRVLFGSGRYRVQPFPTPSAQN